ncbi:hypothetical protein BC828DRAFT_393164 [Blastocladiella britannica]|nr:hypothetical protein BC828DRAFT_393164 [Blastocladiella britannica]
MPPKKSIKNARPYVGDLPPVVADPRFSSMHNDPRFAAISKKSLKVRLDKRFKDAIQSDADLAGTVGPKVDKFGRKIKRGGGKGGKADLERLYDFASSSSEGDSDDDQKEDEVQTEATKRAAYAAGLRGAAGSDSSSSDDDSSDDDSDIDDADIDIDLRPTLDLAWDGEVLPDDDATEPSDEVFDEVLDRHDVPLGDATRRIAVVNMDWDHIKAGDLYTVFGSLKPAGGSVERVTVYASEFGRERMAHEAQFGPAIGGATEVAMDASADEDESSSEDDENHDDDDRRRSRPRLSEPEEEEERLPFSERKLKTNMRTLELEEDDEDFDPTALRRYQLERLRYYFAVVEFDSVDTAAHVFKACDGAEFEATANFFDLRYVPDDVSFADDEPYVRDLATPETGGVGYDARRAKFETKALQHTNLKLTWDMDDPTRMLVTRKSMSYDELKKLDFKEYIASDSDGGDENDGGSDAGEDEEEDADQIARYRKLLGLDGNSNAAASAARTGSGKGKHRGGPAAAGGSDDDEAAGDMQISFTAGLSETAEKLMRDRDERRVRENETTVEMYQRKQREKRAARKAARIGGDADDDQLHGVQDADMDGGAADLGFDDPFFAQDMDVEDAEKAERFGGAAETVADPAATAARKDKKQKKPTVQATDPKDADAPEEGQTRRAKKLSKRAQRLAESRREDEEDGVADFAVNVADPRFAPVLAEADFAIDPTSAAFRDTPGTKALMREKRRRAAGAGAAAASSAKAKAKGGITPAPAPAPSSSGVLALAEKVKRKAAVAALGENQGIGKRAKRV